MRTSQILAAANNCGGKVYVKDGRLWFSPADALNPELKNSIARHKRKLTLLARLTHDPDLQRARLEKRGWFPHYSPQLREVIVLARDDWAVRLAARRYGRALAYYTEEEVRLLLAGLERSEIIPSDIRLVHEAKKKFGPRSKLWALPP